VGRSCRPEDAEVLKLASGFKLLASGNRRTAQEKGSLNAPLFLLTPINFYLLLPLLPSMAAVSWPIASAYFFPPK